MIFWLTYYLIIPFQIFIFAYSEPGPVKVLVTQFCSCPYSAFIHALVFLTGTSNSLHFMKNSGSYIFGWDYDGTILYIEYCTPHARGLGTFEGCVKNVLYLKKNPPIYKKENYKILSIL